MRTSDQHIKIAIVDRDETLLSMLDELLTEEGYFVRPFTEPEDAKRALYVERTDVVLLDFQTGGMDLLHYLGEINHPARAIMMAQPEDVRLPDSRFAKVQEFLHKPLKNVEDVVAIVNRLTSGVLDQRREHNRVQTIMEKLLKGMGEQQKKMSGEAFEALGQCLEEFIRGIQTQKVFSGRFLDVGLVNLMQILSLVGATGRFLVQGSRFQGEIDFANGKFVQAACAGLRGERAIFRLLNQEDGSFEFRAGLADEGLKGMAFSGEALGSDAVIVRCLKQLEAYRALGSRVPPDDLHLKVKQPLTSRLNQDEQDIVGLVARFSRVRDILDHSPKSDVETIQSLIRLRMAGALEPYFPLREEGGRPAYGNQRGEAHG